MDLFVSHIRGVLLLSHFVLGILGWATIPFKRSSINPGHVTVFAGYLAMDWRPIQRDGHFMLAVL